MSLQAKKSLGQNFLKSKMAIHAMISGPEISPDDLVVEIGPGKGALTGPLLETGATVIAFELDQRMVEFLAEKFADFISIKKLILVHQDVLEVDLGQYTQGKPYKVVANIPYYITNMIIRTFLTNIHQPKAMCLLIQKEVAERIVSRDNKESILSISVKLYGTPKYVTKVGRQYFSPSPKVDSAVVLISKITREKIVDEKYEDKFFAIIKTAFGQKRKQAIKNLTQISPRNIWEDIFKSLGIDVKSRAEDINFNDWIKIIDNFLL